MRIRDERPGDVEAIGRVTAAAFASAARSSGTEAAIVEALRDAAALTLSLVAEDEAVIGHIAISPVTIGGAACGWFGLGPVSVAPGRQRQGVGVALIEAALERLRASGAAGCVLLGDPAYYRRFGFEHDPALTYANAPAPYFQRLILAGPAARGEVEYHAAFDA